MPRTPQVDTFALAPERGAYDEYPVLPAGKDPQLHLSRNAKAQPFFLVCEHDTMLAQLSGRGRLEFGGPSSVRFFDMAQGDYAYVPGGYPHRYVPDSESLQYRYKADKPGLEAVAWYCEKCGGELHRDTWDTAKELPQEAYLRATAAYSDNASLRACKACGHANPKADASGNKWAEVAAELRAEIGGAPSASPAGLKIAVHPTKRPMKENVYWQTRMANSQLLPLFPYFDPGSIVPASSLAFGESEGHVGFFIHTNSIDEVVVNFGAADSPMKAGAARVGPKAHGVGMPPRKGGEPTPPKTLAMLNVITQRHPVGEHQHEAMTFTCNSCKAEIVKRTFDGQPPAGGDGENYTAELPTFPTIIESAVTAEEYNRNGGGADVVCPKCGHHNETFNLRRWGWSEYRHRTHAVNRAIRSIQQAARG